MLTLYGMFTWVTYQTFDGSVFFRLMFYFCWLRVSESILFELLVCFTGRHVFLFSHSLELFRFARGMWNVIMNHFQMVQRFLVNLTGCYVFVKKRMFEKKL